MFLQGWGIPDQMDQINLEDMLAPLKPFVGGPVRQKTGRDCPVGALPSPVSPTPTATYLPTTKPRGPSAES